MQIKKEDSKIPRAVNNNAKEKENVKPIEKNIDEPIKMGKQVFSIFN